MYEALNSLKISIAKCLATMLGWFSTSRKNRHLMRKTLETRIKKLLRAEDYTRTAYNLRYIYHGQVASNIILSELQKNEPCLIARFGRTEMLTIYDYVNNHKFINKFHKKRISNLSTLSGFFPANNDTVARFCSESLELAKEVDILCCWNNLVEEKPLVTRFCPTAKLVTLATANPLLFDQPWSQYLEGKKVLVIHPFSETIKKQYKHREHLFKNPKILPEFELKTLQAIQSLADNKNALPYESWFDALDYMCSEISKIDFDVALIGAGAYGMFLGGHCKRIGKQAVHMGGVTQLLFGIYGSRFEGNIELNEYWVRPSENERPKGFAKVEGGCYW